MSYDDYTLEELELHITKDQWNTIILEADYETDEGYYYELDFLTLLSTDASDTYTR